MSSQTPRVVQWCWSRVLTSRVSYDGEARLAAPRNRRAFPPCRQSCPRSSLTRMMGFSGEEWRRRSSFSVSARNSSIGRTKTCLPPRKCSFYVFGLRVKCFGSNVNRWINVDDNIIIIHNGLTHLRSRLHYLLDLRVYVYLVHTQTYVGHSIYECSHGRWRVHVYLSIRF